MNAGLSIDKNFSLKRWKIPFILVTFGMGLFMIGTFFFSQSYLEIPIASALLLMSVLAPTDPVLASDVQVGPPNDDAETSKTKLNLSLEAGLNDGLAFPFVWLATNYANHSHKVGWLSDWVINDLFYKLLIGVIAGIVIGKLTSFLFFKLPGVMDAREVRYGFVALSATLLTYAFTELIGGYGFIAVFIAAIAIRNYELKHNYHRRLHEFNSQVEHTLLIIALVFLTGTAITYFQNGFDYKYIIFALVLIFIIRPISAFLFLPKNKKALKSNLLISFFGIKGIGSLFYLSYASNKANFQGLSELWTITFTVMIVSIIVHGLTAPSFFHEKIHENSKTEN